MMTENSRNGIAFSQQWLNIEDIVGIAEGRVRVSLSEDPAFRKEIDRGADFLDRLLHEEKSIYGVTTGYGDSCTTPVSLPLVDELPHRLYTYHGCGLGACLSAVETRAIMAARLACLCKGFSGVSHALLEQIVRLFDADILPLIPSEGSVGASGDLTPLSYLAAVLCGEREVMRANEIIPAQQAFSDAGIAPLKLRPKEGIALMNGTSVMTGLACLAWIRAQYLKKLATRITAMASFALDGNASHFDETLFSVKPHPGQQKIALWLRQDLDTEEATAYGRRLQDRYSIRCAPHVIGVLADALPFFRQLIENELNSTNDNPVIDAQGERLLHGGHFYGGHIAFAMDSMKNLIAGIADLLDRQMALLVDTRYNQGLPANLSGAKGERIQVNHGLKALQISVSAWTAEALKLTMPASSFSRSTECHNQDKVSMGTIAARDCLRVLELTEQVVAALLISVRQGVALRLEISPFITPKPSLQGMFDTLSSKIAYIEEDRRLEPDLRMLLEGIRKREWGLYD